MGFSDETPLNDMNAPHSRAALAQIAQDRPFFCSLCIFNEVTERGEIAMGCSSKFTERGSDTVSTICVIFHQLPYGAGANLFSVTDIFRARGTTTGRTQRGLLEKYYSHHWHDEITCIHVSLSSGPD